MYAVTAPGISGVYKNYEDIKRIKVLYPYCKFALVANEEEGWKFVNRYKNPYTFSNLKHYGDTFDRLVVRMQYFIDKDRICFNFNTRGVGKIKLLSDDFLIDTRADIIMAELRDIKLNPNLLSGHLISIYYGLDLLGDFIDVDVQLDNHATYYALMSYTGKNRTITRITDKIKNRLGRVSVTLNIDEDIEYIDELPEDVARRYVK